MIISDLATASRPTANSTRKLMKAAVIAGPGKLAVQHAPIPEPGPGEVRVRLSGCGVCASNLEPWAGPPWMQFPTPPGGLGHEGWGTVDALGSDVRNLSVGDPVAALFYNSYAEYDVGSADAVVRLPAAIGSAPFPGEPLGCAMNVFRRSDIRAGDRVAIVGVGFLGAVLTRLAAAAGAHVTAISRRSFALEMARRMGAGEVVRLEDHGKTIERAGEITSGDMFDRVIEATGKQWPLDLAAELTRIRGRLIIAGYHQDGPRQVNMQLWNWRGIDVVNAHERDPRTYVEGIRAGIEAVVSGLLDPAALITHSYPLDHLDQALNATRDRPDGFLKAVVTM